MPIINFLVRNHKCSKQGLSLFIRICLNNDSVSASEFFWHRKFIVNKRINDVVCLYVTLILMMFIERLELLNEKI